MASLNTIKNRILSLSAFAVTAFAPLAAKAQDDTGADAKLPQASEKVEDSQTATLYISKQKENSGKKGVLASVDKNSPYKKGDKLTIWLNDFTEVSVEVVTKRGVNSDKGSIIKGSTAGNITLTQIDGIEHLLGHTPYVVTIGSTPFKSQKVEATQVAEADFEAAPKAIVIEETETDLATVLPSLEKSTAPAIDLTEKAKPAPVVEAKKEATPFAKAFAEKPKDTKAIQDWFAKQTAPRAESRVVQNPVAAVETITQPAYDPFKGLNVPKQEELGTKSNPAVAPKLDYAAKKAAEAAEQDRLIAEVDAKIAASKKAAETAQAVKAAERAFAIEADKKDAAAKAAPVLKTPEAANETISDKLNSLRDFAAPLLLLTAALAAALIGLKLKRNKVQEPVQTAKEVFQELLDKSKYVDLKTPAPEVDVKVAEAKAPRTPLAKKVASNVKSLASTGSELKSFTQGLNGIDYNPMLAPQHFAAAQPAPEVVASVVLQKPVKADAPKKITVRVPLLSSGILRKTPVASPSAAAAAAAAIVFAPAALPASITPNTSVSEVIAAKRPPYEVFIALREKFARLIADAQANKAPAVEAVPQNLAIIFIDKPEKPVAQKYAATIEVEIQVIPKPAPLVEQPKAPAVAKVEAPVAAPVEVAAPQKTGFFAGIKAKLLNYITPGQYVPLHSGNMQNEINAAVLKRPSARYGRSSQNYNLPSNRPLPAPSQIVRSEVRKAAAEQPTTVANNDNAASSVHLRETQLFSDLDEPFFDQSAQAKASENIKSGLPVAKSNLLTPADKAYPILPKRTPSYVETVQKSTQQTKVVKGYKPTRSFERDSFERRDPLAARHSNSTIAGRPDKGR